MFSLVIVRALLNWVIVDNKHKNILYDEQNGLVEIQIICDQESQNTNLTGPCPDLNAVAVRFPVEPNLRCFDDTVFGDHTDVFQSS